MFRCKFKDESFRYVYQEYINKAWLAAITSCCERNNKLITSYVKIPDVTELNLEQNDLEAIITWDVNPYFYTEIQIKINDGDWETVSLVEPGIGEYST